MVAARAGRATREDIILVNGGERPVSRWSQEYLQLGFYGVAFSIVGIAGETWWVRFLKLKTELAKASSHRQVR